MKVIILAGGGGTRLYPLSSPTSPKQFLPLANDKPLIINTIERFLPLCEKKDIIIVTGEKYGELTEKCLKEHGYSEINVVFEPCAKNTAPAIMLGVKYAADVLSASKKEAVFVAPSDSVIKPAEKYLETVKTVVKEAETGKIVTVGVSPKSPDTGFGYIMAEKSGSEAKKVLAFKEKPDLATAESYFKSGNYYWNSGMYSFTAETFARELEKCSPELYKFYALNYDGLQAEFSGINNISIDYAVAEKSENIAVVPADISWSDIGSWDAYYDFCTKDERGNAVIGDVEYTDCKNCLLLSVGGKLKVWGQTDNIIIGANGNFITLHRGKSQVVKG